MLDSFDSPKSLIHNAREDLTDLKWIWKRAMGGDHYLNIVDVDPETGNKTYKVTFTGTIPSRARYIANNVLNNLRHSLDQALVASVEILTDVRSGTIYFPFATSPNDLTGRLKSETYEAIPVALHVILHSFEPYPRGAGYDGGNDFLCAVTKAVGPNKHQITLSPGLDIGPAIDISMFKCEGLVSPLALPPQWDMANNEMILGTVTPAGKIEYNFQILFHVAFGDAGPMFRQPVIPVLDKFLTIAHGIVFGLEAETERILRTRGG